MVVNHFHCYMSVWAYVYLWFYFVMCCLKSKKDLSGLSTRTSGPESTTHGQKPAYKSMEHLEAPIRSLLHSSRPFIASLPIVHSNQRRSVVSPKQTPSRTKRLIGQLTGSPSYGYLHRLRIYFGQENRNLVIFVIVVTNYIRTAWHNFCKVSFCRNQRCLYHKLLVCARCYFVQPV